MQALFLYITSLALLAHYCIMSHAPAATGTARYLTKSVFVAVAGGGDEYQGNLSDVHLLTFRFIVAALVRYGMH